MTQPPAPPGRRGDMQLIIIAMVLGVLAVVLTNVLIIRIRAAESETITLYRLKSRFEAGDKLRAKDVEEVAFPAKFKDAASYWIQGDEIGQVYKDLKFYRPAGTNEILSWAMFGKGRAPNTLDIPPDKRWKTVAVNTRTAPGILQPGHAVDIYATFRVGGAYRTLLVLENVDVAAVGNRTEASETGGRRSNDRKIIVELTTQEATELMTVEHYLDKPEFDILIRNAGSLKGLQLTDDGINPEVLDIVSGPRPDER